MSEVRPYVQAALFCERMLDHPDRSISLIEIDSEVEAETAGDTRWISIQMYLDVRSGDMVGEHELIVVPTDPDGDVIVGGDMAFPVAWQGGWSGSKIHVDLAFEPEKEGIYLFNVYLDDAEEPLTRMPLKVRFGSQARA